ncbi:glycosyltransferase family 2 protein [Pseudohoeflea sp. DP4N28-3]|uniref:Glycosyltransferase family 2 protein n=1 Tax=Pseudohoeflea coraliihabitans TaxID=2860393 RepID=A0ABS6WLU0_9HYPH|nr:glycosyltransferase family 2 protein [Pseudohoeflea sp. DP4N28-3]
MGISSGTWGPQECHAWNGYGIETSRPHPASSSELQTVTVLLAVRNGERFLPDQLASLQAQSWPSIDVIAGDDGSEDRTPQIIQAFAKSWTRGRVHWQAGPKKGFAENFRHLITTADIRGEYVAFCDQDDLWRPDKLANAIAHLEKEPATLPALYCARTEAFSETGHRALSPLFSRPPSFENAMVQSIAGGNTMVMNRAAFELVRESARRTDFVSHDWWCYLMVTGHGGVVHYSPQADVFYRQHAHNLVGANNSLPARLARLRLLLGGRFRRWSDIHIAALRQCEDLLDPSHRQKFRHFVAARRGPVWRRLAHLRKSGVYRQTRAGQVSLFIASVFRLI